MFAAGLPLVCCCREVFAELVPGGRGELVMIKRKQVGRLPGHEHLTVTVLLVPGIEQTDSPSCASSAVQCCSVFCILTQQHTCSLPPCPALVLPLPLPTQGEEPEESDDEDEGRRHNVNDKYMGVNVSLCPGFGWC
jgi:hypothetical protein